MLTESRN